MQNTNNLDRSLSQNYGKKCDCLFRVVEETEYLQDTRKHDKFVSFKLGINSFNRRDVKDLFETHMIYKAARLV